MEQATSRRDGSQAINGVSSQRKSDALNNRIVGKEACCELFAKDDSCQAFLDRLAEMEQI